jgi:uncharacterized protein (TIGR03083 family)
MSDQEIVEKLERVWGSIADLGATLNEADWKTLTDCPHWTAQDHVAHMLGTESRLLGRAVPEHSPREMSHVKNEIGKINEIWVDSRRAWPGARVLEEFCTVTGERLKVLRAMREADFSAPTQTPVGPGTVRDFMNIRIFDCWVHEQDIRRAVQRPGHLEGPVAEHAVGRLAMAMPFVVGKKAQTPDGVSVVFDITGPAGRILPIGIEGGRARVLTTPPSQPTIRLCMDVETFNCLGCGRWTPDVVMAAGKLQIDGDDALGAHIVWQMNFMI